MSDADSRPPGPDIYIGGPIEVASELQVLASLVACLSELPTSSVVMANIEVNGRQLDFVVCTESTTVVVEAKAYMGPVAGKENGEWTLQFGTRRASSTRNAYRQALDGKNRWKDLVQRVSRRDPGYPNACVVAVPSWPGGSSVPSNPKVSAVDLHDLPRFITQPCQQALSRGEVQALISDLNLVRVESVEEAANEALLQSRLRIARYLEHFQQLHGPSALGLVEDIYALPDGSGSRADVVRRALGQPGNAILVEGPSGCGKSLLAAHIATSAIGLGYVPVLLQAQYFDGELRKSLDREASLLCDTTGKSLLGDIRRLELPWLLCVDGYNECSESHRLMLTRSVAALAKRYGAACLVTSQIELERADLLQCATVKVARPNGELKLKIAQAAGGTSASARLSEVLSAVGTGLEARLAGEVAAELTDRCSSQALFDTYVRKVLGEFASEGISLLAELAGLLTDGARFSASVREVERLAHGLKVNPASLDRLVKKNVLAKSVDRMSFGHELFFRAFAAEWAARTRMRTCEEALSTLNSPRYTKSREFVLSTIEDEALLDQVLSSLSDEKLLFAAYMGSCGQAAKIRVEARCLSIVRRLLEESGRLEFEPDTSCMSGLACTAPAHESWTAGDNAMLGVVGRLVARGELLEPVFAAVRAMDEVIRRCYQASAAQLDTKGRSKLLHSLFQKCYVLGSRDIALTRLVAAVASGGYSFGVEAQGGFAERALAYWTEDASLGEQYLAMSIAGRHTVAPDLFAERLVRFIESGWGRAPYHLRLAALHLATYSVPDDAALKDRLIAALEGLKGEHIFIESAVVDALEACGAFEQEKWDQVAPFTEELLELAERQDDKDAWEAAANLFMRQFDHPFSDAYSQAWSELSEPIRGLLSAMACRGIRSPIGMFTFTSSTIRGAARAGPTPFVLETIRSKLAAPSGEGGSTQEHIETFLIAHEVLGQLGAAIPEVSWEEFELEPAKVALLACGRMLYAHAMPKDQQALSAPVLEAARLNLMKVGGSQALAAIATLQWGRMLAASRQCMVERFPNECLVLAREALSFRKEPEWHLEPHLVPNAHIQLGLSIIGRYGSRDDIPQLRRCVDEAGLGEVALEAIQCIEGRG